MARRLRALNSSSQAAYEITRVPSGRVRARMARTSEKMAAGERSAGRSNLRRTELGWSHGSKCEGGHIGLKGHGSSRVAPDVKYSDWHSRVSKVGPVWRVGTAFQGVRVVERRCCRGAF